MASVSNISSNMNTNDSSSYVQVKNTGVFLTSFDVTYLLEGQSYILTSYEFGTGITKRINIPQNATNITAKIEIAQFIGVWATVMVKVFPTSGKYCFQTSGTTLSPFCELLDCQNVPSVGDTPQQSCCCCCCCQCPTQSSYTSTYNDPCSTTSYNYGSDYYSMNSCCGNCSSMNSCCGDGSTTYCSPMTSYCGDGSTTYCSPMTSCCGDGSTTYCSPMTSCCGDGSTTYCSPMTSCCGDGSTTYCSSMTSCCGDGSTTYCSPMTSCCGDGSTTYCSPMTSCCGDGSTTYCSPMTSCCGDGSTTYCSPMTSCGC